MTAYLRIGELAGDAIVYVVDVDLSVVVDPPLSTKDVVYTGRHLVPRVVILGPVATRNPLSYVVTTASQSGHVTEATLYGYHTYQSGHMTEAALHGYRRLSVRSRN